MGFESFDISPRPVSNLLKNMKGNNPGKTLLKNNFNPFMMLWAYRTGETRIKIIIITIIIEMHKEDNENVLVFVLLF